MRRVLSMMLVISMLFAVNINAAELVWSGYELKNGAKATVYEIEPGDRVFVGVYNENDELVDAYSTVSEGEKATVPVYGGANDYARVFVWDKNSLEPTGEITARIDTNGVTDDVIFSDNQQANRPGDEVVGYRSFDTVTGKYTISIDITVWEKGDNAIMLGDSNDGALSYGTSRAILLFNGDNFAVRDGRGDGNYASAAVNLCSVEIGKKYNVVFSGNVVDDTYQIIITQGGNRYTSSILHARKNGESIDTIALVSNSRNTVVKNGSCSNFAFVGKDLSVATEAIVYEYSGFEGFYYGIKVDGKYIRGNNGRLSYDYTSVRDDSAKFLPRDMGDGSHAFVCKSSNNRITVPGGILGGDALRSAGYADNDNTQHWVLEKSENYSEDNLSFYIRHIDSDEYIGIGSSGLVRNVLMLVEEAKKKEFVFEALPNESLLYRVSKTEAYSKLSSRQRFMLESVYESVAGDIFGRYGGAAVWTPRIRMDNMFTEILSGNLTDEEQLTLLTNFLARGVNSHIYDNQASHQPVSTALPGTEGLYWEIDDGVEGTYDFWRGTKLQGVLYKYSIYTADGELQQTINLYVQNEDIAKANAETFKQIIVQIPHDFRKHLRNVKVRIDNANSYNGGGNDMYIRLNWSPNADAMRSTVTHELGHIIDSQNGSWSSGGGWSSAIAQDMYAPSTYGASNNVEDFAEFSRMYFQAYSSRDRQRGLAIIMPERYASFGRLRQNNMNGWGLWEDDYTKKIDK